MHPDLPKLVKQRYGTELRPRTLASIKPEISQVLQSLLDEIRATEDAKVMRTAAFSYHRPAQAAKPKTHFRTCPKSCSLCKQAGRVNLHHYLSECTYLPDTDRKFIEKTRQIVGILDCDESGPEEEPQDYQPAPTGNQPTPSALRIQVRQSPYLDTLYRHNPVRFTIDNGATGNMIHLSTVQKLKFEICKSAQSAHQTDGSSPLKVIGETKLSFTRGQHVSQFEGLVVENFDLEVLAGIPFMEANDIALRPAKHLITLADGSSFTYGSSDDRSTQQAARRSVVLCAPATSATLWPGDYIELELPQGLPPDSLHALESRSDIPQVHLVTESCGPLLALFLAWQEEYESQTCQANPFSFNDTSTIITTDLRVPFTKSVSHASR